MKKNRMGWESMYCPVKKILRIMRLSVFLLLVSFVQLMANNSYAQKTKLSVDLKNASVESVLLSIENQSSFKFIYNKENVDVDSKVSINVQEKSINEILDILFEKDDINYSFYGNQVILTKSEGNGQAQQNRTVSGKVTDSTGAPLPGVSVVAKGTTTGMITDTEGSYSLSNIPENTTLVFSFVGMKTQEILVVGKSTFNVILKEETIGIDEVVTIGYGTVKKSDLTGSVSSVSSKDIGDRVVTDLGSLIQGKVSGVDVAGGRIRIRGVTTFNQTDPIYVIDGFVGGDFGTVNPNDIERIEVLKDASSTAIYGARGANGVVLITTKEGKVGPLKVNVSAYTGIATTPKKLDVLNASQYIDYLEDALKNSGGSIPEKLMTMYPNARKDVTNWQDEVFRTAHTDEISASFSGGSDKATYFTSIGYKYNESITIGPKDNTLYIRNKNDYNMSKWFHLGNNFAFNYNTNEGAQPNIQWLTQMPQFFPIYDSTNLGGYSVVDRSTGVDGANPLISTLSHPKREALIYQANLWAEIEPLKGLKYRIQAGVRGDFSHNKSWQDAYVVAIGAVAVKNRASEEYNHSFNPLIENTLTYNHLFGKHDISVMVGNSWQNYANGGGIGISAEEFANTEVKNVFLGKSKTIDRQEAWNYAFLSYFGRFNYQFDNKYLLTVNVRSDGSPRFAPTNRWGTFPSVAVAWKMHEEEFIKKLNIFDQLKLRVSWGVSGNDAIGDFRYTSQVWTNGVYYPLGGVTVPGATIRDNSSPMIKWESTDSKTVGVDMAFLKNSLTVTADYFIKNTNDILFDVPRPSSLGYGLAFGGNAIVNAASCENKGFELLIGSKGKIKDINYTVNANYTYAKNEVTGLGLGQPFLSGVSRTDIGNPIGYFYGYVADGVFMNKSELDAANAIAVAKNWSHYQEAPTGVGDVRFKDINEDGHITSTDRQMIGNSIPKHLYGLNITLDYRGFDFNVFFQGIAGSDIYYNVHEYMRGGDTNRNQEAYLLDRWISEAKPGNGIVPRAVLGDPNLNNRPSSNMVSSGDYLKLRQLSLGYTIPKNLIASAGLKNARVYANANNLLTISKYHGYDPEVGGDNLHRGIDNLSYPIPRTLIFGVQIGF